MKAQDLAGGLRNFHPAPIRFGPGGTEDFYVRRRDDPLDLLRAQLLHGQASEKTLLAGHRGSGKSTELNRLCADSEIRKRFAVVKFSVKDVLDLTDLSHIDLLFTAVALSYDELCTGPEALELSAQTMAELDRWRKLVAGGLVEEKTRTHDEAAGAEVTAGAKLSLLLGSFFAGITGRLRVEQTTRQVTREMVEPRLSEFLKTLDRFFQDVDLALGSRDRRLLVVIEDLDKIPDVTRALELFHKKGLYLSRPPCNMVYTVPIAIHYAKEFQAVAGIFAQSLFLPNVALRTKGGASSSTGVEVMRSFVLQRLDESLIEPAALEEAIAASGGVFQQLQRLVQNACTRSLAHRLAAITVEEVRDAAADLRAELERTIVDADFPILAQVVETNEAASDEAPLGLLHSLHLIEYRNRERWCDLNPLLIPTLERRRKNSPPADTGETSVD